MDKKQFTAVGVAKGGGQPRIACRGKTVILVPSDRKNTGERTYDVRDAENRERVYTFLSRGDKGGFSGNRYARRTGTEEIGWCSYGNRLHPQETPEEAALHYLKWSYQRSRKVA